MAEMIHSESGSESVSAFVKLRRDKSGSFFKVFIDSDSDTDADPDQKTSIMRIPGIIQGTRDIVVDWKYNAEFIKKKFRNTERTLIAGGGHHLLNESPPIRADVLNLINERLMRALPANKEK